MNDHLPPPFPSPKSPVATNNDDEPETSCDERSESSIQPCANKYYITNTNTDLAYKNQQKFQQVESNVKCENDIEFIMDEEFIEFCNSLDEWL